MFAEMCLCTNLDRPLVPNNTTIRALIIRYTYIFRRIKWCATNHTPHSVFFTKNSLRRVMLHYCETISSVWKKRKIARDMAKHQSDVYIHSGKYILILQQLNDRSSKLSHALAYDFVFIHRCLVVFYLPENRLLLNSFSISLVPFVCNLHILLPFIEDNFKWTRKYRNGGSAQSTPEHNLNLTNDNHNTFIEGWGERQHFAIQIKEVSIDTIAVC